LKDSWCFSAEKNIPEHCVPLQKKCPIYFPAVDQVKVISLSCAKNTSASFSAVVKKVHDFFYLCKKLANYLPVSKNVVRLSQCVKSPGMIRI
jgi:hypothetical protein